MAKIKAFKLRADSPCPCLSGKILGACCLQANGHLHKETVNLFPPPPVTGHLLSGCYLSGMKDCSPEISAEHYMSRTVLEAIGSSVAIRGAPWLQLDEQRVVGINALTAKILCRRHNSALAPLDNAAGDFFTKLQEILRDLDRRSLSRRRSFFLVSGEMIELWMLKVACGLFYSKNATSNRSQLIGDHQLDQQIILNALFYNLWVNGCGLYVRAPVGHMVTVSNSLAMAPLTAPDKRFVGIGVTLAGLELCLVFDPIGVSFAQLSREGWWHRPSELLFANGERTHSIGLTWKQGTPARSIRMIQRIGRRHPK